MSKKKTDIEQTIKLISPYKQPVNITSLKKYLESSLDGRNETTFFNWESFDVVLKGKSFKSRKWLLDTSIKKTTFYKYLDQEEKLIKNLLALGTSQINYIKIIPDEQIPLLWASPEQKIGRKNLGKLMRKFQKDLDKALKMKINLCIKTYRVLDFLKNKKYFNVYMRAYDYTLKNFEAIVSRRNFCEDLAFRANHYSKNQRLLKINELMIYSKKMFALFSGETALLLELQKDKIFPSLVLACNEPLLTLKKYQACDLLIKTTVFPVIFPFRVKKCLFDEDIL